MRSPSVKNLLMAALAGLLCGTVGEAFLFLEAHVRRVEEALISDFRIVAFLAAELPEAKWRVVEEKLRALPGTAEVRFVGREAALDRLREEEPEVARSVAFLGDNPLESAFQVELVGEAIGHAGAWAEEAARVPGIGDIRFKPLQVRAVVQAQFYSRFLRLVLSLAGFFWVAGAAAALWAALACREARPVLDGLVGKAAMAGAGAAGGMGLVLIAALPLKSAPAAWAQPGPLAQGAVAAAGLLGALFAWDWDRGPAGGGAAAAPERRAVEAGRPA